MYAREEEKPRSQREPRPALEHGQHFRAYRSGRQHQNR